MASVHFCRTWGEDDSLSVTLEVEDSFPDAVAELEAVSQRMFTKALVTVMAAESAPDADEAGE